MNPYHGICVFTFSNTAISEQPQGQKTVRTHASRTDSQRSNVALQSNRRERIKTILEAKKEASIKDISDIITDVSEKTIQRELTAMIEDNIVKRHGERRWSKYSLF